LLDGTIVETYKTAAGSMKAYRVGGASTALLVEGTEAREVGTYVVVSEYADEPLMSDQLASEFGIVVEDPAKGLWRLKGESVMRSSER
jgi:hypothetical protein